MKVQDHSKFWVFVLYLSFIFGFFVISAHRYGDEPSNKIVDDFSGYPKHEPPQSYDSIFSLTVDSKSLQKVEFQDVHRLSDGQVKHFAEELHLHMDRQVVARFLP